MCALDVTISPLPASQGGPLARPPLAIPPGTRLRGPAGSLRCSIYRGVAELVASLLKHAATLFPDKSALLARVNGLASVPTLTAGFGREARRQRERGMHGPKEPPFARASSAGPAGERTAACLRLEEPSSAGPRWPEQRSGPEGPRSRGALGVVRGNGQAFPLTRRKGEKRIRSRLGS